MKALTRNTLLSIPLALLLAAVLPGQGAFSWQFLDAFTIAFSFTYVGHLVETLLLKIPGIGTPGGKIVRVLGWFAGGLWCALLQASGKPNFYSGELRERETTGVR